MITIEQTLDIPDDRRIHLDLPQSVPSGRADMVLVLSPAASAAASVAEPAAKAVERAAKEAPRAYTPEPFPSLEALKEEARQKTAARHAEMLRTGVDPLARFAGCLKDVFTEDGVEYQRRMRDEWPD
jgi:hypothetical protein